MDYIKSIDIEFPSVLSNGKFYTLDLHQEVETPTYKLCFIVDDLATCLTYGTKIEGLCHTELWIIRNNPKYNYLWKEEKITL